MNKKELINEVKTICDIRTVDAEKAVNAVFDTITNKLVEGDSVSIFGFGKFSVKEKAARQGFNPATGEKIAIPAKKVPEFKAEKKLKESVNQ